MAHQHDTGWHALRSTHQEIIAAILSHEDQEEAYEGATRLADALREMADQAARVRAAMAAQIKESEDLSLSGLAYRLGMSKSWAAQLMQVARADQGEGSSTLNKLDVC